MADLSADSHDECWLEHDGKAADAVSKDAAVPGMGLSAVSTIVDLCSPHASITGVQTVGTGRVSLWPQAVTSPWATPRIG
jgi:hypothetical protein